MERYPLVGLDIMPVEEKKSLRFFSDRGYTFCALDLEVG